ncbi:MAG: hypothetical protein IJ193_01505 [Bacilli bacterium]|nr:hypothetical protein [Bacilli bacterium]
MFDYTHEVIINSNVGTLTGNKRISTYTDEALGVKHLVIERAGDYRKDLIFPRGEGVVFKTPGYDGQLATLTVTAPASPAAGDVYQFSVFVKLLDPAALSEYAYPNWASFGKPLVVGFTHKTGATFADELVAALNDAIPYNNKFVTVAKSSTSVVLTASMFGMEFEGAKLEKLVEGACDGCSFDKYELVKDDYTATATKVPFGTGDKLVENYRFPTYANRRYAALNSDETPVPGAIYTMYSFAYDSPRPGFGGLSGVGQKVDAVTRHIFWVKSDVVSDFDAALSACGITPTTPSA